MDVFFADDARQDNPSRPGMGPLVGTGGIYVPSSAVSELEKAIDALCIEAGFPAREEFKWSPGRELWMRDNLIGVKREAFLTRVLDLVRDSGGKAIVVVEDRRYNTATGVSGAEEDVTCLLLERVHKLLRRNQSEGIVIVDRPGGGRADEDSFLGSCLETLSSGTDYVKPDRIALNVLSTPSRLIRLLQVADVITSCTVARVGGEDSFSPPIFDVIRSLLDRDMGRIGGVGLTIHPDYKYANLYHWLLKDECFVKVSTGFPFPNSNRPYSTGPNSP